MLLVLSINAFFLNVAVDPYMALLADLVPIDHRGRVGALLAVLGRPRAMGIDVAGYLRDLASGRDLLLYVSASASPTAYRRRGPAARDLVPQDVPRR